MTRSMLALAIAFLLASSPVVLTAAEKGQEKVLLVHVTTLLESDQDRTALVFRVVAAGLMKGRHVILLFDAQGVASLKIGRWFGGHSTPIDRVLISCRTGKDLQRCLALLRRRSGHLRQPACVPEGRGAEVCASKRALEMAGLWPDDSIRSQSLQARSAC